MSKSFLFTWGGEASLTVEEIWPDGDAPKDPTVADVLEVVRKAGSVYELCRDWNLEIDGLEVNGHDSGLR